MERWCQVGGEEVLGVAERSSVRRVARMLGEERMWKVVVAMVWAVVSVPAAMRARASAARLEGGTCKLGFGLEVRKGTSTHRLTVFSSAGKELLSNSSKTVTFSFFPCLPCLPCLMERIFAVMLVWRVIRFNIGLLMARKSHNGQDSKIV